MSVPRLASSRFVNSVARLPFLVLIVTECKICCCTRSSLSAIDRGWSNRAYPLQVSPRHAVLFLVGWMCIWFEPGTRLHESCDGQYERKRRCREGRTNSMGVKLLKKLIVGVPSSFCSFVSVWFPDWFGYLPNVSCSFLRYVFWWDCVVIGVWLDSLGNGRAVACAAIVVSTEASSSSYYAVLLVYCNDYTTMYSSNTLRHSLRLPSSRMKSSRRSSVSLRYFHILTTLWFSSSKNFGDF